MIYESNLRQTKSKSAVKKNQIKNILFITLTNIGDVILTTPVLGILLRYFPQAEITVVASPQTVNLFEGDPSLHRVVVYDKFFNLRQKMQFLFKLRKEKFDLVIDLKNTLFGFLCGARYRTPLFRKKNLKIYKRDIFLNILKDVFKKNMAIDLSIKDVPFYIWRSEEDKAEINRLLEKYPYLRNKRLIAINPFAKSDTKSWPLKSFARLINRLEANSEVGIILVGSGQDEEGCCELEGMVNRPICNLCGKTTLRTLAELLKRCSCLITNDSAPMHLGAAVGIPVIAIFGPTDPQKYAPRGKMHKIIAADLDCQPCQKAQCIFKKKPADCLEKITVDIVFDRVREVLMKST
jgi:lipopolysaccharide heptosyltransferase II